MPKISDARREARRTQILDAALRCFVRNGYQQTSMTDIIAEADLSVGAIYSYFPSKRHLVIGVASRVIEGRRSDLRAAEADHVLSPPEIIEIVLSGVGKEAPVVALIQVWSEAVVDDEIRALLQDSLRGMQDFLVEALTRWAEANPDPARGDDARAWANASVPVLIGLVPGFALQSAIFDDFDSEAFVRALPNILPTR